MRQTLELLLITVLQSCCFIVSVAFENLRYDEDMSVTGRSHLHNGNKELHYDGFFRIQFTVCSEIAWNRDILTYGRGLVG